MSCRNPLVCPCILNPLLPLFNPCICPTNCQKYGARIFTEQYRNTRETRLHKINQPVQYFSGMTHIRNYKIVFVKPQNHQHMQTSSLSECDSRHRIQLISHPLRFVGTNYLYESKELDNLSRFNRSPPTSKPPPINIGQPAN